jgi:hypothetical protein
MTGGSRMNGEGRLVVAGRRVTVGKNKAGWRQARILPAGGRGKNTASRKRQVKTLQAGGR